MNLSDLNNLDFNNIGSWPMAAKAAAIVVLCAAVLGLGYWQDTQNQLQELDSARHKEVKLKQEFETKQAKAASLGAYKRQMKEMQESFGTMLRQLPSKTEVADLLVDITQTGLASGLDFDLFKPQKERPKEFYAELPITLKVEGDYHQLGTFVSGIAALPRIVTLHDINISRGGKKGGLVMQAVAKTYRYLDEEELAAQAKAKKKSKRRHR
jgi:type IV pilus assembly protein PilO